jgi:hypothetical protein
VTTKPSVVHRGGGVFTLGDRRIEIGQGDIVFIPKGVWHGFESSSENTLLVWAVSSSKYLELHRRFFLGTGDPGPARNRAALSVCGFARNRANKSKLSQQAASNSVLQLTRTAAAFLCSYTSARAVRAAEH